MNSYRKVICHLVKNGIRYPVHTWVPRREHGDLTTDAALVLYKAIHAAPIGAPIHVE